MSLSLGNNSPVKSDRELLGNDFPERELFLSYYKEKLVQPRLSVGMTSLKSGESKYSAGAEAVDNPIQHAIRVGEQELLRSQIRVFIFNRLQDHTPRHTAWHQDSLGIGMHLSQGHAQEHAEV